MARSMKQRVDQVAAHGTAQAAALQQNHVVVDGLHQEMVEADLAELVDDHRGVGERRVAHQRVEQRCFPGAEEAGQDGERDGLGWAAWSL